MKTNWKGKSMISLFIYGYYKWYKVVSLNLVDTIKVDRMHVEGDIKQLPIDLDNMITRCQRKVHRPSMENVYVCC